MNKKISQKIALCLICLLLGFFTLIQRVEAQTVPDTSLSISASKNGFESSDSLSVVENDQITVKIYSTRLSNSTFTIDFDTSKFSLIADTLVYNENYNVTSAVDEENPGQISIAADILPPSGTAPRLDTIPDTIELCSLHFTVTGNWGITNFILSVLTMDGTTFDDDNPGLSDDVVISISPLNDEGGTVTGDDSDNTTDENSDSTSENSSDNSDTSSNNTSSSNQANNLSNSNSVTPTKSAVVSNLPLTGIVTDNTLATPEIKNVSFGQVAEKNELSCKGLVISGSAESGSKVLVIFNDSKTSYSVQANSDGLWSMIINDKLEPKVYDLTLYSELNSKYSKPLETHVVFRMPCKDNVYLGSKLPVSKISKALWLGLIALSLLSVTAVVVIIRRRKRRY